LREIAGPVRSVQKVSRKIVEATILRLCEERYLLPDDLADLDSHLRPIYHAFIPAFRKGYLLVLVIRTRTDLFPDYSGSFRFEVIG
jgi:hypothetical protein